MPTPTAAPAGRTEDRRTQDYLRAAIYAQESAITAKVARDRGNINDYQFRDEARAELKSDTSFWILSQLRNALAHGVRPTDARILKIISTREMLDSTLRDLLRKLS